MMPRVNSGSAGSSLCAAMNCSARAATIPVPGLAEERRQTASTVPSPPASAGCGRFAIKDNWSVLCRHRDLVKPMPPDSPILARVFHAPPSGHLVQAQPLDWNIKPENMPYALHVGIQPQLVAAGEVIVGRLADEFPVVAAGDIVRARRKKGGVWEFQPCR